ncbi:uncharacterized protein DUF2530 [Sediminihabitans luteus]|uniref:Uncharacterized protein DUF2530 n=1 Tax=Sediminihabitans luteus TaxID=1138585 RepID=A0A2M9CE91_9CELL|nr:DUF2530 domain-containing protein [Sediminihabitans luteus]PJJ70175.1 uncharacterized protein DUF2530 [Sediminihabitans luteus]GII97646.1 hypothetical protein Slu03_00240 [Sediminihabitans luteus]
MAHRPGVIALLTHPELRRPLPPPLEVDLRRVILLGILAFAVAGVVCGVLAATGTTGARGVAVCVVGVALGGLGLLWVRRRGQRG